MADRRVTQSRKDSQGDITHLCNPNATWSPRKKADAVSDIQKGTHRYYVKLGGNEVDVHVVNDHLRTDPDASTENNLDNLPDC